MSYIYNVYKTGWKVKSKDNANLLLTQHRLKLEWNQMVWSVNNLRCGTAEVKVGPAGRVGNATQDPPSKTEGGHPPSLSICVDSEGHGVGGYVGG